MKRLSLVLVAVTLCAAPAWGDLTMKMSSGAPDSKERARGTTYAAADKVAMVWQLGDETKRGSHVVFDAGKQTLWIIDDSEKSYTVLDKATMDQVGKQMEQVTAQMQEALAKMPPEQRAMMEKQMAKMTGGGGKPIEHKITKAAASGTFSGFPCTRYDATSDGVLSSHLWVTPFSQVKVSQEDMAVFFKMADFFKSMTSRLSEMSKASDNPFAASNQVDGLPILDQLVDKDGKVTREVLIEAINHDAPPAGVFDVPAGYKQKEMPKPGRPGK